MNLKLLSTAVLACGIFMAGTATAAETTDETEAVSVVTAPQWRANMRRLGLQISSTEVDNAGEYQNSPVSALNSDSQTLINGVFDFVLEHERENMRWDNSVFLNYGKTKIKPYKQPKETTENEDEILLTSDYMYKLMKVRDMDFGPFASIAYQTEFTSNDGAPRMKVFRGKAGPKLFSGDIVKELYVAAVGEYDITYSDDRTTKFALETGWRLEYDVREGVKMSTDGYFRKYLAYSEYVGTDLKYDLNLTARMDVDMTTNFTFGPYISYRQAKSREAQKKGSNFMIGLSLAYKELFHLFN